MGALPWNFCSVPTLPARNWSAATLLAVRLHSPLLSLPQPPSVSPLVVCLVCYVPAARVLPGGEGDIRPGQRILVATGAVEGANAGIESIFPCNKDDAGLSGATLLPHLAVSGDRRRSWWAALPNFGSCPVCGWISLCLSANLCGMGWVRGTVGIMLAPGGVSLFSLGLLPPWCC